MAGICKAVFPTWPSKQTGKEGFSGFLFLPTYSRTCLLPEPGEAGLVLSPYSAPTDLEPLAAVR